MRLDPHHEERRIFDVPSRRRLFECVEANPGSHLRQLARHAGVPLGTTLYHMTRLESLGIVVVRRDGRYKRYFAQHALGVVEKEHVSALRHAVPFRIVLALIELGSATQRQLCLRAGVSRSTLSFHACRLVSLGILRREKGWPENHYSLQDPALTTRLLAKYRGSLDAVAAPRGASVHLGVLTPVPAAAQAGSE